MRSFCNPATQDYINTLSDPRRGANYNSMVLSFIYMCKSEFAVSYLTLNKSQNNSYIQQSFAGAL
jgi:hypothetical protein